MNGEVDFLEHSRFKRILNNKKINEILPLQQAYHAATVIRQMQRMALSSGGSSGRNSNNSRSEIDNCVNGGGVTK